MRHHAMPGALLPALALAAGGGGSPTSAPTPKPTPPLVIPDPAFPPAPTQASGPYNDGKDLAADIHRVLSPLRSIAGGPVLRLD